MMDGEQFALATVQYPGIVHPRGFELLDEFRVDPFPEWRYSCGLGSITKTICLVDREQTALVRYRTSRACTLTVRLLTSFRDYHSLTHRNADLQNNLQIHERDFSFTPYGGLPGLSVLHSGIFKEDSEWFLRHVYPRERERGLDCEEDLFSPGTLTF